MLNRFAFLILFASPCLLISHTACKTNSQEGSEESTTANGDFASSKGNEYKILVKVGSRHITVGDFIATLNEMSPYIRARYRSPERRRELLESLIDFELLAQEAEKHGLTALPEVQRYKKHLMIEQMLKERVDAKLNESKFSQEEVQRFYDAHREEFNKPEEVRVSHILVASDQEAKALLNRIKGHAGDLDWFEDLARKLSLDKTTKNQGGDLNFFPEIPKDIHASIPKEIIKAAFKLKNPGDVYPEPIRTSSGYHVIMLARRRPALSRTASEAARLIRNRLLREEREKNVQALVTTLKKRYPVEENKKALDAFYSEHNSATHHVN